MVDLNLLLHDGASLRRVRLHGGGDALRGRQRLERLLAEVDWALPGLGPRALLVVRRMAVDARRGFAPRAEGGAFARQVSGALRERAAGARRPWLQRDAEGAEAVCFADEAELLACLWRDWSRGQVPSHWWWAGVLRHRPVALWLREQLFARGDRLVPVLALLARQGELPGCVRALDEADAAVALRAVQASHALSALDEAAGPSLPAAQAAPARAVQARPSSGHARVSRPERLAALKALVELVPELRTLAAAPTARRLLAVALAVQRGPRWARSTALPQALAELEAASAADPQVRPAHGHAGPPAASGGTPPKPVHRAMPAPVPAAQASPPWATLSADDASSLPATPRLALPPVDAAAVGRDQRQGSARADRPTVRPPQPAHPPVAAKRVAAETGVSALRHTEYGGLFYLLNIALAWRVYGDFTMPRHPGISLPPWDLLAWTGRAWFGEAFEADPLWPLLAELAGRELPARPGDDFDDAPDWVPPPDAVADSAAARAEPHRGRRWLQHWRAAVEMRLRSALGCGDGVELLCRHRAGIAVSEAAVDVTLSLAALPLPIRFAGLDRDPGWIPAAGRSVFLHFD